MHTIHAQRTPEKAESKGAVLHCAVFRHRGPQTVKTNMADSLRRWAQLWTGWLVDRSVLGLIGNACHRHQGGPGRTLPLNPAVCLRASSIFRLPVTRASWFGVRQEFARVTSHPPKQQPSRVWFLGVGALTPHSFHLGQAL